MTTSRIEWTDRSDWNPIRGCTRVSEGCRNCYAETIAGRFSGPGQPFAGFATQTRDGGRWTGRVELVEQRLALPLRWRKPARIFVNSAFDLFHEQIADDVIDCVFAVMALAPRHTFQVLTKRAKRMRSYFAASPWRRIKDRAFEIIPGDVFEAFDRADQAVAESPLRNVWLGVSVEDQTRADERIPDLLATPAALRFVSAEPLLGRIDFRGLNAGGGVIVDALAGTRLDYGDEPDVGLVAPTEERASRIDGPSARPMHPDWPRAIRDQCAAGGVPFFFKQWGEHGDAVAAINVCRPTIVYENGGWAEARSLAEAIARMRSGARCVQRVRKARAGRLLDGRTHDAIPEIAR